MLVQFVTNAHESNEAWALEFFKAAAEGGRLYRDGSGGLLYVDDDQTLKLTHSFEFLGAFMRAADVRRVVETDQREFYPRSMLRKEQVDILRTAFSAQALLHEVHFVLRSPRVTLGPAGPVLTAAGYSAAGETCCLYIPPRNADGLVRAIEPRDGTEHLDRCFSDIPFASPRDRANFVAWLLSGVVIDPLMTYPLLVVNAQQRGIGKTTSVSAAGIILEGTEQSSVTSSKSEELIKEVASKFKRQSRFVLIDNVSPKVSFESSSLAALLTQSGSQEIRLLGTNTSIGMRGAMFAVTINHGKLSSDLADRTLAVELSKDVGTPLNPYPIDYARRFRNEIYGELLGLAMRYQVGQSAPAGTDFRFRRWLNFVAPIIEPIYGQLQLHTARALDDLTQELYELATVGNLPKQFVASDLVATARTLGEKFQALSQEFKGSDASVRGKAGSLLARNVDQTIPVEQQKVTLRCVRPRGKTAALYTFIIEEAAA